MVFIFSTVQSILSDERKEQWKKYKKNGVKVDTVFFDEAHHLGEVMNSESVEDSDESSPKSFFSVEAQEVDKIPKSIKKEQKSNEWTKAMTFLKQEYQCNILGCTATPKGPKMGTPITTVFGDPSFIVPIQNGVDS